MSNRNEERTLSGSTEIFCDILDLPQTINAIRIRNQFGSAGQVLAKNPTTNKIEWAVVPIADDTITTGMIQDLAVNNDKIANNTIQNGKIADNTIEGTKLATDININTTGALTIGGITTFKGIILFNNGATSVGTFSPTSGTLAVPTIDVDSLVAGTAGELQVINGTGISVGRDALFGGEMEMAVGGSEVFNMNSHNLTNGGDATFNNLTLNTALNMSNIDLDLGTGDLTCDNATFDGGAVVIDGTGIVMKVAGGGANTITMNHTNGVISCKGLGSTGSPIDSEGGEMRSGGGLINTENGNLNVGSGTITNTGAVNCGAINAGSNSITTTGDLICGSLDTNGLVGPTTLSGLFTLNHTSSPVGSITFGSGSISSAGTGNITSTNSNLDINAHSGFINCDGLSTNNGNLQLGSGQISNVNSIFGTGIFRASELQLGTTGLGINTASVIYPNSADIRGYNMYNSTNDIPRILACKSFTADHLYSRSLNTSYKNIDKDTTTLNVNFAVPISCKVIVEVGMMARSNVAGQRLLLKLVDSAGNEFYAQNINDTAHGYATTDTVVRYRQFADSVLDMTITKFFLSFPTSKRNSNVNMQPQARVDSGTSSLFTGSDTNGLKYNPMYIKVESSGNQSQSQFNGFNWHLETSSGGDDY